MPTAAYVRYDSGLNLPTAYLTPVVAFFLGGIYSAYECVIVGDKRYWISPFRYNYDYANAFEIENHFAAIRTLASNLSAEVLSAENIRSSMPTASKFRLLGFGAFFESVSLGALEPTLEPLASALMRSPTKVKHAFVAGVFDGRGSLDYNRINSTIRYIVLDSPNREIGDFLYEACTSYGLECNYNTARDRVGGGRPRNDQLRVRNISAFMSSVGFISQKKFGIAVESFTRNFGTFRQMDFSTVVPGLKGLST